MANNVCLNKGPFSIARRNYFETYSFTSCIFPVIMCSRIANDLTMILGTLTEDAIDTITEVLDQNFLSTPQNNTGNSVVN